MNPKTLFTKQQTAKDFFLTKLKQGSNTLDTSDMGTGKTVVAAHLAQDLNRPVAVVCPKAVLTAWRRELEAHGVTPLFVLNYEKLRTGKTEWMSKRGKKIMTWHLPKGTLVLVDEIHKCAGHFTQNAQLLISLKQQGHQIHGMSATSAEDPTKMRALGYILGLHNLNKVSPDGTLKSWTTWMMKYGCRQNMWNQWELRKKSALVDLNKVLYSDNVRKLTVQDFPESFRGNRVIVETVTFANEKKIAKAYADMQITPEILEDYIANGTVGDSDWVIVNLLRARQLAEAFKIKDIAEIAKDTAEQGKSVVVFVNFRESVDMLQQLLKCPVIKGGQTEQERQKAIDDFQADDEHIIVANIAAGGTGVSLHDTHGNRPRVSLISPSFDVKSHIQSLGRIHRNGAKSDALQKILVAAGTPEERVMEVINEVSGKFKTLHKAQA